MALPPLIIGLTLGAGVIIGKYALLAYNEELFEKLLEKTRKITNKFPEHRKEFWNNRINDIISLLPKKSFIGEIGNYSKEEVKYFAKQIQEFYDDLVKEISTLSSELGKELLTNLQNIFTPLKEHAEKIGGVVAGFAASIVKGLNSKDKNGDKSE